MCAYDWVWLAQSDYQRSFAVISSFCFPTFRAVSADFLFEYLSFLFRNEKWFCAMNSTCIRLNDTLSIIQYFIWFLYNIYDSIGQKTVVDFSKTFTVCLSSILFFLEFIKFIDFYCTISFAPSCIYFMFFGPHFYFGNGFLWTNRI